MGKQLWFLAAVVGSLGLGCDGDPTMPEESDDDAHDGGNSHGNGMNEHECMGDQWIGTTLAIASVGQCATITGGLSITGNELTRVELPVLKRIDGIFTIWGNPNLEHAGLPKLESVGGFLDVSFNDALSSLELPVLERVNERAVENNSDLSITDNALLPACQADVIRDQLLEHGFKGRIEISANQGTCPP